MRPDISHLQRNATGQFALHVERVLLHARRARVRIDDGEALSDTGQIAQRASGRPGETAGERVGKTVRRRGVAVVGRHIRRCRRVPRRVIRRADGELRRPIQAVTAADGGLGRHLPRQTDAWPQLVQVRIADVDAVAVYAREFDYALGQDPRDIGGQRIRRRRVKTNHHRVVPFLQAVLALPAHTHVHGQRSGDANVVLKVRAVVIGELVELGWDVAGAGGRRAQQHVGQVRSGAGYRGHRRGACENAVERKRARAVGEIVAVVMNAPVIEAALEIVAPLEFREPSGKILRVVHIVKIIVRPQAVLRRHGDVGERGRGDGGHVTRVEAQGRQIESLADLIPVIREAIEAVANGQYGGRRDGQDVVELRGVHLAIQQPLVW